MYVLPQVGILKIKQSKDFFSLEGYCEVTHTPVLWKHILRPSILTLIFEGFGIKYEVLDNLHNLINALKKHYEMYVYCSGGFYCGICLDWKYDEVHADISMPKYARKQLQTYTHPTPKHPQRAPFPALPFNTGEMYIK